MHCGHCKCPRRLYRAVYPPVYPPYLLTYPIYALIPTVLTEIPNLSAHITAENCTVATASAPGGCTRRCTRSTRSYTQSLPIYPLRLMRYPIYLHTRSMLLYSLCLLGYPIYLLIPGGCTRRCTRSTRSHTQSMPLYPLCPLRYPIHLLILPLRSALRPLQVPPAAVSAGVPAVSHCAH